MNLERDNISHSESRVMLQAFPNNYLTHENESPLLCCQQPQSRKKIHLSIPCLVVQILFVFIYIAKSKQFVPEAQHMKTICEFSLCRFRRTWKLKQTCSNKNCFCRRLFPADCTFPFFSILQRIYCFILTLSMGPLDLAYEFLGLCQTLFTFWLNMTVGS